MMRPTASGMEWQTWKNSTRKAPRRTSSPGWTTSRRGPLTLASLSFPWVRPPGEGGGVDGDLKAGQDIGQGPGVVLVPVGDDEAPQPVLVLLQVADVGDDQV